MKTNSDYKTKTTLFNPQLYLVLFFTGIFCLSIINAKCEDGDITDEYCESCTSELISSSFADYSGETVWLEGNPLQASPLIYNLYKSNEFLPVWTTCSSISEQSLTLIKLFKNSYNYGIEPSILNIDELEYLVYLLSKEKKHKKLIRLRTQFEFLLTNSAFTFMLSLNKGTEYARELDIYSADVQEHIWITEFLNNIKTSDNIEAEILSLQPDNQKYILLQHELENVMNYIKLVENHDINADNAETLELYINMLKYLMTNFITENLENKTQKEQFNILLSQLQQSLNIWESGKLNIVTRNSISLKMRSRYADLAYEMESIRSHN